jgi:glycosyltransferase involved in cell wall biosynthesis
MKKINILHTVGGMNRGGAETFLMNVLRRINKQKFTFVFLCYGEGTFDYEDEIISLGGKIVRTPGISGVGPLKYIQNIEQIIKDEQIDVVHTHTYYNSMFSLIAAKNTGIKVRITHSHNTKSEESPNLLKALYFKISKLIINRYSTNYLACGQDAGEALFYNKNKFTIIDNGIILDDFYYLSSTRQDLRKEFGISKTSKVVLHVGRFDTQKNHTFLVDVFSEYLKLVPDSKLILVGDGTLRTEIEKKVIQLKIEKNVLFLGKRGDVNKLYNIADLFLFPSLHEGLPVTLVEAQANGLICLISDAIDKTIQLTDCIYFDSLSRSAKQWAQKMDELNLSRIDTKEIMQSGRYDMVENIKSIENLYQELLKE